MGTGVDAALLATIRGWRSEKELVPVEAEASAPPAWQSARTDLRSDERLHPS